MKDFIYNNNENTEELIRIVKDLQQYEPEIWQLIEAHIKEEEFNLKRYGAVPDPDTGESRTLIKIQKLKKVRTLLKEILFYNFEN
tara:strand:+ start:164 stop:418 length:255 start_codon:yes stop_codon:yes gene_type:complete